MNKEILLSPPKLKQDDIVKGFINASRLLIIKFYTTTCPPCKVLKEKIDIMEKDGLLNNVCLLNVDAKDCPEITSQFQVKSVPAIFFLKNGEVVDKATGLDEAKDMLIKYLNQYK